MDNQKVMIGLSGGINSMALLCWLKQSGIKPKELHLFYAHLEEHSPETFPFVKDGIRYARKHFDNVFVKVTRNSVLRYFESQNMIPHPMISPCSRALKIGPMNAYAFENDIHIDLVGYVRHEVKKRAARQADSLGTQMDLFGGLSKVFPISEFDNDWCFKIVDEEIGWHPPIYDILDEKGNPVFNHNNCLPCKNMETKNMVDVQKHYPAYHAKAMAVSAKIGAYWGRNEAEFYATFGRDNLGTDGNACEVCRF